MSYCVCDRQNRKGKVNLKEILLSKSFYSLTQKSIVHLLLIGKVQRKNVAVINKIKSIYHELTDFNHDKFQTFRKF